MNRFFVIQESRIRIARLFLGIGIVFGILSTIANFHMGMMVQAIGGVLATVLTPIVLWLGRRPNFKYLPNIAALLIAASFAIVSAFTALNNYEGLVWMGVVPIMYFYLTNRYIGVAISVITIFSYMISFVLYKSMHGVDPISAPAFGQAMAVFMYSALLAWLYESEWTGIQNRLLKTSDFDFLTGIYNRRAIIRNIEVNISKYVRNGEPLSVILFDIDNFKSVNDTYGHEVGDQVLKELSETVRSNIRRGDVFGRWGGEEFIIACNNTLEESILVAEKLRANISNKKFRSIGHLSASFGVVQYRGNESLTEMMKRVDGYLYVAKKTKDCVVVEDVP
jgi:diguanylate cyclase (GGDEF)-like protein